MGEAVNVYCHPVSATSTYIPLLFQGIEHRYRRVYRQEGSLPSALAELEAGRRVVVHVHWEEFQFRACAREEDAEAAAAAFADEIAQVSARGAPIVWTVHNEWPHLIPFRAAFLRVRALLAERADAILVHNSASIDALAAQVPFDRAKVTVLPHPSYLDQYENEATLRRGLSDAPERRIQGFGYLRLQKGFGDMIAMAPPDFLASRQAMIRISGRGPEAGAVITQQAARIDVHWDVRHVPSAEAPQLLRSAACVVLPYERLLTSGVALLAISVGALIVAVDVPQLRELLPPRCHALLYPRGDAQAFRRAIDEALSLEPAQRRALVEANLAVAQSVHPRVIAQRLAAIYDAALARPGASS